ncbi:phage tail protein, partial [Escherichia coli]
NKLPYFNGDDTAALTDLTQVGRDIIGKSTIADILTYLGLGTASKRNVGTGANQIPDMSSFQSILSTPGYQRLPGGIIIQ